MLMSEVAIRKAKPGKKSYKLSAGDGLWLFIEPNGSKLWRYRYKFNGNDTTLSLGSYPETSFLEAKEKRFAAQKLLQNGINPSSKRKEEKRLAKFDSENTFSAVAETWHKNNLNKWTPEHARKLWRRLELHILPALGSRPIKDISTLELLEALRKVEDGNRTETTHRALQTCRAIFRFAVLTQKIGYNPASDLQGALKAHKTVNYPTIAHHQLPRFLEELEKAGTSELNRLAVKLLILTFVRQGEMRRAKWTDFDLKNGEWKIRPETTKMRTLHHVPLSKQAIHVLRNIGKITGNNEYVFASQHNRRHPFMSENTINKVIHNLGYKGVLVGHGFRSMASTILNENGFRADVIERQLAHMPRDRVRAAYNRAEYLPERREMMQWWGDFIAGLSPS